MPIIPTRASLLSSRIGDLRDWGLILWCPCRAFPRHMAVEGVADERGNGMTLEALLVRLRCEKCGCPPVKAEAKRGDPFAPRVSAVTLLESRGAVDRNRG